MKIWAIANQKGGVGKTTSTVSLGGILAQKQQRVLLIDLDPHASLSTYLKVDKTQTEGSYALFNQAKPKQDHLLSLVQATAVPNLSLLPASLALATLDRSLGASHGMGLKLKAALELLKDAYDFVLIDCPPVVGILMINALAACQTLIVPQQTEHLALHGLEQMMQTVNMVNHTKRPKLFAIIVPTLYDQRTKACQQALSTLRQNYPGQVWHAVIPSDTKLRDASFHGLPASIINNTGKGVNAYRLLLKNLIQQELLSKTREFAHE